MSDIYIKMILPENYEDVCNALVIEDMHIHPDFQIEDVTQEITALRAELTTMTQDRDSLKITASRALDGEATLRDQLAAPDKDAERYRWLRSKEKAGNGWFSWSRVPNHVGKLDAAIDAAMKEKP